jgi:hypothetical protein
MKWYWACRLQAMGKSDLLALAQSAMEASKESGKHADWTAPPLVDLQAGGPLLALTSCWRPLLPTGGAGLEKLRELKTALAV